MVLTTDDVNLSNKYILKALNQIEQYNFGLSIESMNYALFLNPTAQNHHILAIFYMSIGDCKNAIEVLERALKITYSQTYLGLIRKCKKVEEK